MNKSLFVLVTMYHTWYMLEKKIEAYVNLHMRDLQKDEFTTPVSVHMCSVSKVTAWMPINPCTFLNNQSHNVLIEKKTCSSSSVL